MRKCVDKVLGSLKEPFVWFCGLLFLASGLFKLADLSSFSERILSYGLIAGPLAHSAALLISLLEILLGGLLFVEKFRKRASISLIILLIVFSAISGWARESGDSADCGCFGDVIPRGNDNWLLAENAVVIVMLVLVSQKRNTRNCVGSECGSVSPRVQM